MTKREVVCAVVLGMLFAPARPLAQEDAAVGTWRLNHAKSVFTSPAPKKETVVIESAPNGFKFMAKGVDANDNPTSTTYTATYNGADAPVTIVGPQAGEYDTISVKRLDARKVEGFVKKNGRVVQTYSRVVSRDRDTMTITLTGANTGGQRVVNVAVYDLVER